MPSLTADDVKGTAALAGLWWDLLAEGLPRGVLEAPGAPDGVSVARLRADSERELAAAGDPQAQMDAVQAMLERLSAAGRLLHAQSVGPPRHEGRIAGISASAGGVPKLPRADGVIGPSGLDGDRQADRRHHGRPWQALCLWSVEVIAELQAEGHPIAPGCAGENLTLSSIDWLALRPGVRLKAGEALLEVTLPALPCDKNARWFIGGDFTRMSYRKHPGVSRWYASVLRPGRVQVGDAVVVEP